jgi:hypothetical protein
MKNPSILPFVLTAIGGLWTATCVFLQLLESMMLMSGGQPQPEMGPVTGLLFGLVIASPGILMLACGIRALRQPTKRR